MLLKSYPTIITHSVSAGALLCDATTANAFIAPTGIDFGPYRGKQIEIWSGSTLWASAWVSGTAPGGEDISGGDLLAGWNLTSGWTAGANCTIDDSNSFTTSAGGWGPTKVIYLTIGALYKLTNVMTANCVPYLGNGVGRVAFENSTTSYRTFSGSDGNLYLRNTNAGTTDITSMATWRALSPASTGALLLSSNGGSRGWAYKHASFNPNAAVTLRILARRIASGNGGYYK